MVDKRVSLQSETISVSDALTFILEGTGLDYKLSRNGYLLIDGIDEIIESNIQHDVSERFSVEALLTLSRIDSRRQLSEQGRFGSSIFGRAMGTPTIYPVYNEDGSFFEPIHVYRRLSEGHYSPLHWLENQERTRATNGVLANMALSYELIDGLLLKIKGGVESRNQRDDFYQTKEYRDDPRGVASVSRTRFFQECAMLKFMLVDRTYLQLPTIHGLILM